MYLSQNLGMGILTFLRQRQILGTLSNGVISTNVYALAPAELCGCLGKTWLHHI